MLSNIITYILRYGLFASLSTILKSDMEKYLSQVVLKMIESLKSTEGVMVCFIFGFHGSFQLLHLQCVIVKISHIEFSLSDKTMFVSSLSTFSYEIKLE